MENEKVLSDDELQQQIRLAQQRRADGFKDEYEALVQKWKMQIQGFPEFAPDGRVVVVHRITDAVNS